jgi:hypothetical protein
MAVTALAEDDDASRRIMPLDDAHCSKCRRSNHHEESGGKLGGNRRCARTRSLQFFIDRLHDWVGIPLMRAAIATAKTIAGSRIDSIEPCSG